MSPNHHLDKRADALLAADVAQGDNDDLLTTAEVAEWLDVSQNWLEVGRSRGWGPPFIKIHARCVRYRRGDAKNWLRQRTRQPATRRSQRAA